MNPMNASTQGATMKKLITVLGGAALAVALACGGGGGGGSTTTPPSGPTPLTAGQHTLGLSVAMGGGTTVPVSGIAVTVQLPAGVTVATGSGDPAAILDTSLSAGSAITGTSVLSGSHSASTRQSKLTVVHGPTATWSGEYLRLKVTVPSGSSIYATDFTTLNATPVAIKVVGVDTTAHSTVVLTSQATATLRVVD